MGNEDLVARVEKFDSTANAVRNFPESPEYKILKTGLIDKANKYFKNDKGELQAELAIDEGKARAMAKDFWAFMSEYVARNYLKLSDSDIAAKKAQKDPKDPASDKSVFDTVITDIVGVDEDAIYSNLRTRGSVTAEQIPTLVSPIYESHDRRDTTKRTSQIIKDNKDADASLAYIKELKRTYPKALSALSVPTTYRTIEEVQGLVATVARAIPRDSPIKVAETYKKAA